MANVRSDDAGRTFPLLAINEFLRARHGQVVVMIVNEKTGDLVGAAIEDAEEHPLLETTEERFGKWAT